MAVQELNEELTVLHSVKLVKAMLQGAGALPGALLHTVHSMGLITCCSNTLLYIVELLLQLTCWEECTREMISVAGQELLYYVSDVRCLYTTRSVMCN